MHLVLRPGRADDLAACVQMIPTGFQCEPDLRNNMPAVWKDWLSKGLFYLCVVQDAMRSEPSSSVGFGSCVFLRDEFVDDMHAAPRPYVSAELAARWLNGECPLLSLDEVRAANSTDGLNLYVPQIGWTKEAVAPEYLAAVKMKIFEALLHWFRGYRLKTLIQEFYSSADLKRAEAIGMIATTDYADYFARHPERRPAPGYETSLAAVRPEDVPEGGALAPLFAYTPPRIKFRHVEQQLLHLTLLDLTDEEIAAELCISKAAVHKRWHTVFERSVAMLPTLFPGSVISDATHQKRGAEKRRHLVRYLREHPEELRPHLG
jgi:hypothetical protein